MPGTYELLATAQRPAPLAGTFTVESSVEVHANETHFLDVLLVE